MSEAPICDFFTDEPIITPAKFHTNKNIHRDPQIKTAICTFLCENIDREQLQPILQDCRFLYYVYGRSGKVPIFQYKDLCLIVLMTVGSPVAAAVVEELHYLGIQNVIAYGTAGLLDDKIDADSFVLLEKAIRDEGASYHYCPPSLYVETDAELTALLEKFLQQHGKVQRGITWTMDALFRETGQRKAKRMDQGAVVVEMECAGFAAAAKRLGLRFAEFVFFSDLLTNQAWAWTQNTTQNQRRSLKVLLLNELITFCPEIKLPKRG